MGTSDISATSGILSDLGLADASALVLCWGAILQFQYVQCSLLTTIPSVLRPSYVQVIEASPTLTKKSGCDVCMQLSPLSPLKMYI